MSSAQAHRQVVEQVHESSSPEWAHPIMTFHSLHIIKTLTIDLFLLGQQIWESVAHLWKTPAWQILKENSKRQEVNLGHL